MNYVVIERLTRKAESQSPKWNRVPAEKNRFGGADVPIGDRCGVSDVR